MKHCPWKSRWPQSLCRSSYIHLRKIASFRPYLSGRWKYCPVRLISDLIQAWRLQFYPRLWPSIIFTEPTTKSSEQCCQICLLQTKISRTTLLPFWKNYTCWGPYPLQNCNTSFQALWEFSFFLCTFHGRNCFTPIIIIDRFYIALFSAVEQTHCARMWFYMSE